MPDRPAQAALAIRPVMRDVFAERHPTLSAPLVQPEKPDLWSSRIPACARVPEFHASDDAPVSWKIDHARLAAGRNSAANMNRFADVVWTEFSTQHIRQSLEPVISLESAVWAAITPPVTFTASRKAKEVAADLRQIRDHISARIFAGSGRGVRRTGPGP